MSSAELARVKKIVSQLNPGARILECDYADIDIEELLDTGLFDYRKTEGNAGWIRGLEEDHHDDDHHHHHEHHEEEHHHHHHHHDEDEGEAEEYGIGTFVYYRRKPFDINKFDWFVGKRLPKSVIRAKGLCWFDDNPDMSFLFEQAGRQIQLKQAGMWYATAPEEELESLTQSNPDILKDWDPEYGDRMQKIVFIGRNMDKDQIIADLDTCLQ